jgi:hypothetical protein
MASSVIGDIWLPCKLRQFTIPIAASLIKIVRSAFRKKAGFLSLPLKLSTKSLNWINNIQVYSVALTASIKFRPGAEKPDAKYR